MSWWLVQALSGIDNVLRRPVVSWSLLSKGGCSGGGRNLCHCTRAVLGMTLGIFLFSPQPVLAGHDTPPERDTTAESTHATAEATPRQDSPYSMKPPFSPDEFWAKVLGLLNRDKGFITKEQFEHAFHVRFGPPLRERDATTYTLDAGRNWYFDASLTLNAAVPHTGPTREFTNAYTNWHIDWSRDDFATTGKQRCITAEIVRAGLMANGWTSPWSKWGLWEEERNKTAEDMVRNAPPGGYMYPESPPMPRAIFAKTLGRKERTWISYSTGPGLQRWSGSWSW